MGWEEHETWDYLCNILDEPLHPLTLDAERAASEANYRESFEQDWDSDTYSSDDRYVTLTNEDADGNTHIIIYDQENPEDTWISYTA